MSEYVELSTADLAHRWRERTVLECAAEAVVEARGAEEYRTPEAALRWLLGLAWDRLSQARRSALNGKWSIDCDNQVAQIVGLTGLTGPQPWGDVPVDLLLDGVYERIHEETGCPTPLSDDDRREAQAVMDGRLA